MGAVPEPASPDPHRAGVGLETIPRCPPGRSRDHRDWWDRTPRFWWPLTRSSSQPVDILLAAAFNRGTGLDVVSRASGPDAFSWPKASLPGTHETFGQQSFNPSAYYLVRDCDGTYALRAIRDLQIVPTPELVVVRTIVVSPFASDPVRILYTGGFDANYKLVDRRRPGRSSEE